MSSLTSFLDKLEQVIQTIIIVSSVVLVLTVILLVIKQLRSKQHDTPFKRTWVLDKVKGIYFGKDKLGRIYYSPTNDEGHVGVFAGSGEGKTQGITLNTCDAWDGNGLYIDISGDIEPVADMPRKLSFKPLTDQKMKYNVFSFIDSLPSDDAKEEALEQLAADCIPVLDSFTDNQRYFAGGAQTMLKACLIAFYFQGYDWIDICMEIVKNGDYKGLFTLIDKTGNETAMDLIGTFQGESEKNVSGCKRNLNDFMGPFYTNKKMRSHIGRPKEDEEVLTAEDVQNNNVFICIDDDSKETFAPLLKLISIQVLKALSRRENYSLPKVLVCLDEFASLGAISIEEPLQKLRKKNVRIMLLMQSIVSLDIIYNQTGRRSIMSNIAYKVLLGASDPEDQKYFADLIGQEEKTTYSSTSAGGIAKSQTQSSKRSYKIEPSDLDNLKGDLIIKYKGGYIRLRKVFHYKEKRRRRKRGTNSN